MSDRDLTFPRNIYEWSEKLLDYYFSKSNGEDPVVILVVGPRQLAEAVGASGEEGDDALQDLLGKLTNASKDAGLFKHAVQAARGREKPDYLPHLIISCLAATHQGDATDQQWDSGGYIRELTRMCGQSDTKLHLDELSGLWCSLKAWLDEHRGEYRTLVLPDPGGWTRIGYSVRLAFPPARDLETLAKVLTRDGLDSAEPPVRPVLDAVQGERHFSKRFKAELVAFRTLYGDGVKLTRLFDTPLWAAVRAATAMTGASGAAATTHAALVVTEDNRDRLLTVVSDGEIPGLESEAMEEPIGRWTRRLVQPRDGASVLEGRAAVPGLTSLVRGGVIPLVEELHGDLESTDRRDQLTYCCAALVHENQVADVKRLFGTGSWRAEPIDKDTGSPGHWWFVSGVRLRTAPTPDLAETSLSSTWVLHDAPQRAAIRLAGGIAVGDGWLATPLSRLQVRVDGATSASCTVDGVRTELLSSGGSWPLPQDLPSEKDLLLEAEVDGTVVRRTIRLLSAPLTESFRAPAAANTWVREGQAGASLLLDRPAHEDHLARIEDAGPIVLLGRDVGVYSSDRAGATWAFRPVGRPRLRCLSPGQVEPSAEVADGGAKRQWRRMLNAGAGGSPSARHIIQLRGLSTTTPEACRPSYSNTAPSRMLSDVIAAAAAVANRRTRLEWGWLRRAFEELLGVPPEALRSLHRAWKEAGLVDEVTYLRWSSGRPLFARRPHLVVFDGPFGIRACLGGLVLATTTAEVEQRAARLGIEFSVSPARSPYVPPMVILDSETLDQLEDLGTQTRLEVRLLRAEPFGPEEVRDLNGRAPSVGYGKESTADPVEGVTIFRRMCPGSPTFYSIEGPSHSTWTYFWDAACFWASAFRSTGSGAPLATKVGDRAFIVRGAHLPLAAARWLLTTSGERPGPSLTRGGSYEYWATTAEARDAFLASLDRFVQSNLERMTANGAQNPC